MSTLRPLPFVLDTSIFPTGRLHFATLHWKFCSSFGQKNFFNKDLNGERFDGFSLKKETSISHDWHTFKRKGLRATRKVAVGEGGNSDDTEDTVKSTIKKTKRVFAMQKNLLQETDEKKKRNSSRRKGNLNTELDVSYEEGEEYMSNMQKASNNTLLDRKYTNGISGVRYTSFTATNISETRDDEIERDFDKYNQELEENFSSKVKVLDLITETNSTTTKPKRAPSFSTEIIETNGSTSKLIEEQIESNIDGLISELDLMQKEELKPPPLAGANAMNIILVTAECAPWSKTGGLGDVAGSLPKALARRGHRVMVVTPRYGNYSEPKETGILKLYNVGGQDIEVTYYQAYIDGVDFVFIDSHVFWHRDDDIYGGNRREILKRMALFCKAAVEIPWHVPCGGICYGDGNLVFIANDWHTALLPVYLKAYYRDNGLMIYTRSVLVIHNIAHQGRGPLHDFNFMGLPEHYRELFKLYDPVGGEHCNIFAAGIKTADRIVTVSHGYAWEIKTIEGGWGLHGIMSENDWKLRGIVNGIDMNEWNPQVDFYLNSDGYTNYSIQTFKTGKAQCKTALQRELGLPVRDNVPLLGFIGRLDGQKGVDLIFEAIPWMLGQDVQLIMLGTGRADLEEMLKRFDAQNRDKIRSWVGFSVKMAHRITAGVDILLMPSRFEPCGLNQLYAMIYGTIPVVHAVGGLRDTVQPFDPYNDSGFGWTFDRAEHIKLIHALGNCLHTYRQFQSAWERLQIRGMSQDISWDRVSQNYEEVLVEAKYQW